MTNDNYWPEQAEGGWKLEVPRASSATALAAKMGMTKGELDAAGKDEVLQVMRASKMYVNSSHAWFLNYAKPAARPSLRESTLPAGLCSICAG